MQAYSNMEARAKWEKNEAKRASKKEKYIQRPRLELVEVNAGNALQMQKKPLKSEETPWTVHILKTGVHLRVYS